MYICIYIYTHMLDHAQSACNEYIYPQMVRSGARIPNFGPCVVISAFDKRRLRLEVRGFELWALALAPDLETTTSEIGVLSWGR